MADMGNIQKEFNRLRRTKVQFYMAVANVEDWMKVTKKEMEYFVAMYGNRMEFDTTSCKGDVYVTINPA